MYGIQKIPKPSRNETLLFGDICEIEVLVNGWGWLLFNGGGVFFLWELKLLYDKPVPGIPTVVRVPFLLRFTRAPLPPIETLEIPFLPILSRKPGAILKLFLKLNPIAKPI